jgi:hypothetical protein
MAINKLCPTATHDVKLNLKNRDWAFKNVGYGAANPELPNEEFWASKGKPEPYRPGTWGPSSADKMMSIDGRAWRRP